MLNRKPWSESEKQFLIDNASLSVAEIAIHLNRSEHSVSRAKTDQNVNKLQFVDLPNRRWKVIEEFPKYEVSDHGEVRNSKRGNILKTRVDKNGYVTISFKEGKTTLNRNVHRFVALAFIKNPNNLPEVNHDDCNKQNNYFKNLEWISKSGNITHAFKNDLIKLPKGEKHWNWKGGKTLKGSTTIPKGSTLK